MNQWLPFFMRHAVVLLAMLVFMLHGLQLYRLPYLDRLDAWMYDARLRAHAPQTLDTHVVIIDIDEASLATFGRWPWSRDTVATLVRKLGSEQRVAALGFDMVFAGAESPQTDLALAAALESSPSVLGYYFTSDRSGHTSGALPAHLFTSEGVRAAPLGGDFSITSWTGYGGNLEPLGAAAKQSGFFNAISDDDGLIRKAPLLTEFQGKYYESLALALYRRSRAIGDVVPEISPVFDTFAGADRYRHITHVRLSHLGGTEDIPVNANVALLVPYRGKGGPGGGSFRYISAQDVLLGKVPPNTLKGQIVLVGSSAPALEDLRVTPMSSVYPGVEVQANLVSALAERHYVSQPDYAIGFEVFQLIALGVLLLLVLPRLSALGAIGLGLALAIGLWVIHDFLFSAWRLVVPSASAFSLCLCAYIAYTSYGFFVEGRRRRHLVRLFGSYVAPERVDQMMRSSQRFSMEAKHQVLTVMFCDMRGFTKLSQSLPPLALQSLLNEIFTKLSAVILKSGGTIDKYMGDCVMAFWGAPQAQNDHAARAVACAVQLQMALEAYNQARQQADPSWEAIHMGIGLHTGLVCVGDMGSMVRRSYTVIGDAVNIASRLEGLCKTYKVPLVVSQNTKLAASSQLADGSKPWTWQSLGSATIDGTETAIDIYTL